MGWQRKTYLVIGCVRKSVVRLRGMISGPASAESSWDVMRGMAKREVVKRNGWR